MPPVPVNPNLTPPPNTWQNGKFTMPPGLLDMLAQKQQQAGVGQPGGAPGAGPQSWSQYLFSNPDVMQEWQRLGANPKNPFNSADEYAQWHYGKFGQSEGRQAPPGAGAKPFVDQLDPKSRGLGGAASLPLPIAGGLLSMVGGKNKSSGPMPLVGGLLSKIF